MARKNRDFASQDVEVEPVICPLCERAIPDDQIEYHHLVPKSKGGKAQVPLHRICHSHIHAAFTDAQAGEEVLHDRRYSRGPHDPEVRRLGENKTTRLRG